MALQPFAWGGNVDWGRRDCATALRRNRERRVGIDEFRKKKWPRQRQEFIELLFPVAIGVGFAEHIQTILLHKNYDRTPDHVLLIGKMAAGSGYEIVLLLISMIVVIWSWIWYVPRIRDYPLDYYRFLIDIAILVCYLVLLTSSWLYDVWFFSLAIIWWLYLAWDIALLQYMGRRQLQAQSRIAMSTLWAILVTILSLFHHVFNAPGAVLAALSAIAIVVIYRLDQRYKWGWPLRVCAIIFFIGTNRGRVYLWKMSLPGFG